MRSYLTYNRDRFNGRLNLLVKESKRSNMLKVLHSTLHFTNFDVICFSTPRIQLYFMLCGSEWTMGQWVMGHGSDGSHKWMGQMGQWVMLGSDVLRC